MVIISAHWFSPLPPDWKGFFEGLKAQVHVTTLLSGDFYYKHGTTIKTRLTVLDKIPRTSDPLEFELTSAYQSLKDKGDTRRIRTFIEAEIVSLLNAIPARTAIAPEALTTKAQRDRLSPSGANNPFQLQENAHPVCQLLPPISADCDRRSHLPGQREQQFTGSSIRLTLRGIQTPKSRNHRRNTAPDKAL